MTQTLTVLLDEDAVAAEAASVIARAAREAVAARGRFTLAVSGGHTPGKMLRALAAEVVPWDAVSLFQVDERIAPAGAPERNATELREALLIRVPLPAARVHLMPVERADLGAAARDYARLLVAECGAPPVLDLVHLGLGPDGHTASLVPGDPVLGVTAEDVALAGPYQGCRRMTLTYPVLDRARQRLWVVTGATKKDALRRLRAGDGSIPAGRVRRERALILADRDAAGECQVPPR